MEKKVKIAENKIRVNATTLAAVEREIDRQIKIKINKNS